MKDLLEKKILKNGPYRPSSGRDVLAPIEREKNIRRDWKNETNYYKSSPFILGYTGYIPGFNTSYGLPFMRAVEQGGKEWREKQNKLRSKRDILRSTNPRNLARARQPSDNVDVEVDHGHHQSYFDNQVSSERPPIVGYTGHIPGAKGEVALSRRYAQAAKKGLELLQKVRESRLDRHRNFDSTERVLDTNYLDDTGHTRT
ncbi:uncharacterized protein LOC122854625 isoform X2 [Aphidius gifuensis]|nr:uncharacterized protein LOC122854625 isoform X2 [Aphidius gifuensis]XP_044011389.1 uncharacterized protein LOC122854625 isoform X2 [Aphidius gifuensis]